MSKNIFIAKAKDGNLDFGSDFNRSRLKEILKENDGKVFKLEMMKSTRTKSQNSFYFLYLNVIEQETGNNSNDLHEYFKRTLLHPKFITVMGQEIKIPASTTELSKHEFGEYLDKISALTGVPIPDPKDAGYYTEY